MIETHSYPGLTPVRKVFGLTGARVYNMDLPERRRRAEANPIGTRKLVYKENADPTFENYGPKTDSEFESLIAERGGLPT